MEHVGVWVELVGAGMEHRGAWMEHTPPWPDMLHPLPDVLHACACVLHPRPDVLHPRPDVLHPRPDVLHPRPDVLHARSDVLHARSDVLHARSDVLHPLPDVLDAGHDGSGCYPPAMTAEDALLAQMRAAPDDEALRLVYADALLERGDPRGELVLLDSRDRLGALATPAEMERLLHLSAEHGFPRLPDDPDAHILDFEGGGAYPVQYTAYHGGHSYYLRWRYGFSIDVDDEGAFEGDLDLSTNEWTFRETNVILSIVSAAIHAGMPLSELTFPDEAGIRSHADYRVGRCPPYGFPAPFELPEGASVRRTLALRDFARWHALHRRWQRALGVHAPEPPPGPGCACGVAGLRCFWGTGVCR
jgi:uncharacterized protein (TIGR02996 family)